MGDGIFALVLALVAVGVVLYLSFVFSRHLAVGAAKINKSRYVKVVDRVVLGQDRLLLIAMIGGKYYLIGSTAQSIQILTELDGKEIDEISQSEKTAVSVPFQKTLQKLLSKKPGDLNE